MNLFAIFLTGLTTGGLSCLAMQGGLLASVISNQKKLEKKKMIESTDVDEKNRASAINNFRLNSFDKMDILPASMFMVAKLISHTILGFFLGWLGSTIMLSLTVRLIFQSLSAFFMLATAMNLLNVHPIFRFVVFQPPKFLQKIIRNTSKGEAIFSPIALGLMTVFIPCGVTQAMMVLAVNSASSIAGALIMFSFILGTTPIFTLLGVATAKFSEGWNNIFSKVAAISLIMMFVYSINGVLLVMDSPLSLHRLSSIVVNNSASKANFSPKEINQEEVQKVTINVMNYGYEPQYIAVQKGVPVELTLKSDETYTCALDFVFRGLDIHVFLEPTDIHVYNFTPQKEGRYTYACSMGMYSGVMEVI